MSVYLLDDNKFRLALNLDFKPLSKFMDHLRYKRDKFSTDKDPFLYRFAQDLLMQLQYAFACKKPTNAWLVGVYRIFYVIANIHSFQIHGIFQFVCFFLHVCEPHAHQINFNGCVYSTNTAHLVHNEW